MNRSPRGPHLLLCCALALVPPALADTAPPGVSQPVDDPLAAGKVHLLARLNRGGEPVPGNWFTVWPASMTPQQASPLASKGPYDEVSFSLPPGRYRVRASNDQAQAERLIRVDPGSESHHELLLDAALVKLSLVAHPGDSALNGTWFKVYRDTGTGQASVEIADEAHAPTLTLTLPAGSYLARAGNNTLSGEAHFEVQPGDALAVQILARPLP